MRPTETPEVVILNLSLVKAVLHLEFVVCPEGAIPSRYSISTVLRIKRCQEKKTCGIRLLLLSLHASLSF